MLRSWKLGRAFGIPLYIHSTFLLLPAWGLYQAIGSGWPTKVFMLVYIVVMFGCILLHELGHALMARLFGIGTRDITLYPIGGVARLEQMSEEPAQEVAIALAGPAVNLVIVLLLTPILLFGLLMGHFPAAVNAESYMDVAWREGPASFLAVFVNFLWLSNAAMIVFNLIPAFPLDGGRVLRALLALGVGHLRATELAARIGIVLAFPIAALSLLGNPMPVVIAAFLIMAGQMELAVVRYMNAQRQQPILAAVPVQTDAAQQEPAVPRFADAMGVLREPAGFSGYLWDARLNAWVLWRNGRPIASFGAHSE
jgi:Zn-dependent protease